MKITPDKMPMVKYWKTQDSQLATLTTNEDGATIMRIKGEDYPFPGFPRSHLLFGRWKDRPFGPLSVLKHEIKNQIFNETWRKLEEGMPKEQIIKEAKKALWNIYEIADTMKYDMMPPKKMFKGVKELWRVFTLLEKRHPESAKNIENLKKVICFIVSDDDAYRFRVQWIIQVFSMFRDPIKNIDIALQELEIAEVVGDMKERIRLLRRVLMVLLEDQKIRQLFLEFFKEMKWKLLKIGEMEKYHFRAKYFKVDLDKFEY